MTGLAGLLSIALAVGLINGDLPSTANGLEVDSQLLDERLGGTETVLLDGEKWENENDMTQTNRIRLKKNPTVTTESPENSRWKYEEFSGSQVRFLYILSPLPKNYWNDYWKSRPWLNNKDKMHVIPTDKEANVSDGDIGYWTMGGVSLTPVNEDSNTGYLEYSPIVGVRIGITPPSAKEDNTFVDWVDMLNTKGRVQRYNLPPLKNSTIVYDTTTTRNKEFHVPNFRLTGFRLKRFDETRSEFKGPRNSSLNFPNKSDFIGVTDIIFYGYQEITVESVLRRVPSKLGPFLESDENKSYNTGTWRQRFDCSPGEHAVGYSFKTDIDGTPYYNDDAGLTGLRLLCSSGPVVPEDETEPWA